MLNMKKNIHPKYYNKAKVKCACGNSFEIGSTLEEIQVEVCSACHPFYTGKKTTLDVEGRIEKFKQRMEKKAKLTPLTHKKKKRGKQKDEDKGKDKKGEDKNKRDEKKIEDKKGKDKKTTKKKISKKKKDSEKNSKKQEE
jgi:large subunit ribosomal protein L31